MENASKALIIAGAILLSILLISLGIMIFNQAQSAIDGSGMSDAQLIAFNQKWLKYEGKQKGSTIRHMVQEVMANNNSEEASTETMVSINCGNSGTKKSPSSQSSLIILSGQPNSQPNYGVHEAKSFSNTTTYNVSFTYDEGRIVIINVSP